MKVLLKQDVDNLGYSGQVINVADGYGRNYLIPRDLAVKATRAELKQAMVWRERASVRLAELRKEHEALADRISGTRLEFTARAGETGKLYGSVTTADVVDQLNETLGTEVDRRHVISGPLRQLGEHSVTVRLSRDYQPQIRVVINLFHEEEEVEEETIEDSTAEEETSGEEVPADETVEDSASEIQADEEPVIEELEQAVEESG